MYKYILIGLIGITCISAMGAVNDRPNTEAEELICTTNIHDDALNDLTISTWFGTYNINQTRFQFKVFCNTSGSNNIVSTPLGKIRSYKVIATDTFSGVAHEIRCNIRYPRPNLYNIYINGVSSDLGKPTSTCIALVTEINELLAQNYMVRYYLAYNSDRSYYNSANKKYKTLTQESPLFNN